jgi:hypothetical protein
LGSLALTSDIESVEYEGAIKGSGGSREDDSIKEASKGFNKDAQFGPISNSSLEPNRFGGPFGNKTSTRPNYDEKNNYQFPENNGKSQEEESVLKKVKNENFLQRFKQLGEAFRSDKISISASLPSARGQEPKRGLMANFGKWDEEEHQPPQEVSRNTEPLPEQDSKSSNIVKPNSNENLDQKKQTDPVTAEKKKPSDHPMADTIQADLHQILKKSTETSMSKTKLLEKKAEIEKNFTSNLKTGKESPDHPHFTDEESSYNQNLHGRIDHKGFANSSPVRYRDVEQDHQQKPSRVSSRASQGLLTFLSQVPQQSETFENFGQNGGLISDNRYKPTSMELLAEKPFQNSLFEESKPELTAIEEVDMQVGNRSRKSYFPEKLLKKVKADKISEEELEEENDQLLAHQFKGPHFGIFHHGASNLGLQGLFGGLGLGRDDSYNIAKSSGVLERLLEKKECIKGLQIESLNDFGQKLTEERRANMDIIGIDQQRMTSNDISLERKPFEKIIRDILLQKLGLCFDMASRLTLLTDINKELDEKFKIANEIKKDIEDIELPKAEEINGEWTEQRLFNKISHEYKFQYFKYSLQRDTGQIDITFAMDDVLFFSLHFNRLVVSGFDCYFLQTGGCKHSPIVNPPSQKTLNPLNNPKVLSDLYGRIIATSTSDQEPSDALNFLVYLGYEQRRINIIKKSLNLSVAKHKISDIVIDMPAYIIHFLMFPKIAKVNFSLKVSTSLLVSEFANVNVQILSSQHKKKNIKNEVFSELEDRIKALVENFPASGHEWLIEIIDKLAEIINQDF